MNRLSSHVLKSISRLVIAAALLLSSGAHLAVLQTVAWTKMTISYSRDTDLRTSLQKTFDGQHPCGMCLKVKKAASADPSLAAMRTSNSPELICPSVVSLHQTIGTSWALPVKIVFMTSPLLHFELPPPKNEIA